MARVWKKIDESEVSKRPHLKISDEISHLREYTIGQGFGFSETNDHMSNLQKGANCSPSEKAYREKAIRVFSAELRRLLIKANSKFLITSMPPHTHPNDDLFDNRLEQVIDLAIVGLPNFKHARFIENKVTRPELKNSIRQPSSVQNNWKSRLVNTKGFDKLIIVDDTFMSGCSIRAASDFIEIKHPDLNLFFLVWAKGIYL